MSLEDALLNVWRQSLVENKKTVTLAEESFPIRSTAKRKLKQIDCQFDGKDLRGLEQNPDTKSRLAAMARNGKKVMQFSESGRCCMLRSLRMGKYISTDPRINLPVSIVRELREEQRERLYVSARSVGGQRPLDRKPRRGPARRPHFLPLSSSPQLSLPKTSSGNHQKLLVLHARRLSEQFEGQASCH